jgi:hypothetical protein
MPRQIPAGDLWSCTVCGRESNSALTVQCDHPAECIVKVRGFGAGKRGESEAMYPVDAVRVAYERGRHEQREADARIAEKQYLQPGYHSYYRDAVRMIAKAIRAAGVEP